MTRQLTNAFVWFTCIVALTACDPTSPPLDAGRDGGVADGGRTDARADDASFDAGSDGGVLDAGIDPVAVALASTGAIVTLSEVRADGARLYELTLSLPDDHDAPMGAHHDQYLTLIHRGFDRPTNLVSTGYSNYLGFDEQEITEIIAGNQLVLDKRFHNGTPADFSLFDRRAVAADAHDVVTRFRALYTAPWISSGYSNGGVDVVSFRAAYPDDVVGTVALAAPFMEAEDARFLAFFDTVDPSCQDRLVSIQRAVLGPRRAALEPLLLETAVADGSTFERVDFDAALEAAALSYPWLFWQYFGTAEDCADLAEPGESTDEELAELFYPIANVFGVFPMSDDYLDFFGAYFYEVQRDAGWPALPRASLLADGLIRAGLVDMERGLVPEGVAPPDFDAASNAALRAFAEHGDGVVFIYSTSDPWYAAAVLPAADSGHRVYRVLDGNHASSIEDLTAPERDAVRAQLRLWAGLEP